MKKQISLQAMIAMSYSLPNKRYDKLNCDAPFEIIMLTNFSLMTMGIAGLSGRIRGKNPPDSSWKNPGLFQVEEMGVLGFRHLKLSETYKCI